MPLKIFADSISFISVTIVSSGKNDIIEKSIGVLGRWQLWVCLAIFLVKFPVAWHQLNIVFEAPPAEFSCADNTTDKCSNECSQHVFNRSLFSETLITQFDLVCGRSYLAHMAQTITMLGILFGNLVFGYLSDRFGRKNPLVLAVILQFLAGNAAAFMPWLPLVLIMRFISSMATGGTMVTSFVLIMELIGTKWRTTIGILYQIPFDLGHLSLALFGFLIRDWKYLQVAISAPSLFLVAYYWILPESPRWLITAGRTKNAVEVLEKGAKFNNLPITSIKEDVDMFTQKSNVKSDAKEHGGNAIDLVRTPILRIYTICICFNWLVCGLCFFGVAQYIGRLGGNIFINVAISGVIQVPGTFFALWSLEAWGRRKSLIVANVVAGISVLLIGIVPDDPSWLKPSLSFVGIMGLAVSFPTVYIYSGELFPTLIRNIGVGTCSMCARIGSMVAPFVAGLSTVAPWVPTVIFGTVPLLGAILCLKLPETLNCKLPDTIEEAEQYVMKVKVTNGTTNEMFDGRE
ncbi:hypothetical protein WA026_007580 [Henosepilachna vigintioctopunctata]|uniref:Major facilitator superfamily (MFS) profile domain-containing protein n=1 Tax=Henosepilachna vigintioctopunctata TaxID=420089 RepID=A0AAW1UXN5_9CUCU